jgi:hypothetical protein
LVVVTLVAHPARLGRADARHRVGAGDRAPKARARRRRRVHAKRPWLVGLAVALSVTFFVLLLAAAAAALVAVIIYA